MKKIDYKSKFLEKLLPIATKTKDGMVALIDALQKQAPDLCKEIIKFSIIESLISNIRCFLSAIVTFVLAIIYIAFLPAAYKYAAVLENLAKNTSDSGVAVVFGVFAFMLLGMGIVIITVTTFDAFGKDTRWLKAWIAPRLFLIEYVKQYLKQ